MFQTRHSPIIVGDRYELAEAFSHGGDNDGGLLAKSEYQTALLSMSGYNKYATSEMNDHGSRKSSQIYANFTDYSAGHQTDGSYYTLAPAGISASEVSNSSAAFGPHPDSALHGSQSSFQSRTMYNMADSDFDEYGVRKALAVESFAPVRGSTGTHVNIYLRSDYDLLADPVLVISVLFGTRRVSASLTRVETSGPCYGFVASAVAPDVSHASSPSTSFQLHLKLQIQEQSGQDAGTMDVGYFQYVANVLGSSPQIQEGAKKRKLSDSSITSLQNVESASFASTTGFAFPQAPQVLDPSSIQSGFTSYGRAQNKFRDITSQSGTPDLSLGSAARPLMRAPNSQSNLFSPSYSVVHSAARASDSSSVSSAPLIRTSTIQQSPGSSPAGHLGGSAFNPYPLYGQKAVLKLKGNLNSMADNWTPEEWAAKRRLVQFFRSRDGCIVNAHFAPVKPEDRQPNSITISCIWWEERQECFATSVDTIALLEQLVDNRFTVEEKNRIRRNLEGFKPLTVAKGKADSEEFFKVIMGFPNPKPRNIEKDVKVFEWKILAGALKKIMSKYSASHSSTAGPLQGSHIPIYSGYQSDPTPDHQARVSSRSASISTASSNYAQTLKSNMTSPNETLPSQHPEAVTVSAPASIQTLTHNYVSPSLRSHSHFQPVHEQQLNSNTTPVPGLSSNFTSNQPTFHQLPADYPIATSLERSRSYHDLPDFEPGDSGSMRYVKRPRANTSSASSLHHHSQIKHAAYAFHQATSRSFSEQPDPHHQYHHRSGSISQLPSLSEEYATVAEPTPTPEGLYMPQPRQPGRSAALVDATPTASTSSASQPYEY